MMRILLSALLFLSLVPNAFAVDGVIEIDQACVAVGCFPGDDPGFPVILTRPGSYRLTSNLEYAEGTSGVEIDTLDVTLDLNGFTLRGPNECSGSPPVCTSTSFDPGLRIRGPVDGSPTRNVRVRNGIITGASGNGLLFFDCVGCRFEDLHITGNGAGVVNLFEAASVEIRRCHIADNSSNGLVSEGRTRVIDSTIQNNNGFGVDLGLGSIIEGSLVHDNQELGIRCQRHCMIVGNTIIANGAHGVLAQRSVIRSNTIAGHGNNGIGQSTIEQNLVIDNFISENGGFAVGTASGVGRNGMALNNGSADNPELSILAIPLAPNLCNGDTDCR